MNIYVYCEPYGNKLLLQEYNMKKRRGKNNLLYIL